ncbi:MAG: hypothetical protein KF760_24960 [Candidatus Eremiobacteraeota bacterium]|nr:hypothetical protein [Candidatus Eremiobacteraeota bacterium]MCW5870715.1 hypothetical protein [Candidatus Eremiobacteraeota bacterium]
MKKIAILLFASVVLGGCSQPAPSGTATTSVSVSASATPIASAPDREAALAHLRKAAAALEAKNYEEAATYFKLPEGAPPEVVAKELAKLTEKKEISSAGVEKLAKDAKWGSLQEVFGDKGARWTERAKVPPDQCYALSKDPAEVGLFWDGTKFLIFRLDDVGKL